MSLWRAGLVVVMVVAGTAFGGPALGADRSEADLIKQGVEKRKLGEDAAALDLFQQAYQLQRSPKAAAQIGLAEIALGRWQDAEGHLQEAVAAPQDPWIKKNLRALTEALASVRGHLGELDVVGTPAGAEILIEGEVRGTLPLPKPLRVRAGDCRFEVRALGHEAIRRTVQINANELTREAVKLVPEAPAVAVRRTETPVAPAPVVAPSPAVTGPVAVEKAAPPRPEGHSSLRTAAVVLAGAGVAALVTGALLYRTAGAKLDRINADADATPPRPYDEANGNWKTYDRLGLALVGTGAAAIIGGGVLFFAGRDRAATSDSAVAIGIGPGNGPSLSLAGKF